MSKEGCPGCEEAKAALGLAGRPFRTVTLASLKALAEVEPGLAAALPDSHRSFPAVFDASGAFVGGCKALAQSLQAASPADAELERFCLFPLRHPALWERYLALVAAFWTPEEINYAEDRADWAALNADERHFISMILAFFASSDSVIQENLAGRFMKEVSIPEARMFFGFQVGNEGIHAHTYGLLIDTLIDDPAERRRLFRAVLDVPAVAKKIGWALKWLSSERSLSERLVAFACVEGIHFSGSFCSIFWLKQRGLMHALSTANDYISRDEHSHMEMGVELFHLLPDKPSPEVIRGIVQDAVSHEVEFITEAIPCALVGMSAEAMSEYIRYVADRLLHSLGCEKAYGATNPFPWMVQLGLSSRSNMFERHASEYSRAGVLADPTKMTFQLDAAF